MKRLLIFCFATVAISSCTKLHEEIYDEHIKRPQIDVEVERPQWDSIPQIDNDIELELKE